jgi:type III pantothenate kinase
MITLCIDIGNTLTKLAIFRNNEMTDFRIIDINNFLTVDHLIQDSLVEAAIISNVSELPDALLKTIGEKVNRWMVLDHQLPLPFENCYETKETLGKDRLAAVSGGQYLYPGSDLLIIDAGTAIKYDIINRQGQYLGGNISPGLQMRFKALNYYTNQLPLLDPVDHLPNIGRNTNEAIRVGVQRGILFEIESTIGFYKHIYPELKVLLTGGDTKLLDNKLKNVIFVVPNLVMIGLNRILNYNIQVKE